MALFHSKKHISRNLLKYSHSYQERLELICKVEEKKNSTMQTTNILKIKLSADKIKTMNYCKGSPDLSQEGRAVALFVSLKITTQKNSSIIFQVRFFPKEEAASNSKLSCTSITLSNNDHEYLYIHIVTQTTSKPCILSLKMFRRKQFQMKSSRNVSLFFQLGKRYDSTFKQCFFGKISRVLRVQYNFTKNPLDF